MLQDELDILTRPENWIVEEILIDGHPTGYKSFKYIGDPVDIKQASRKLLELRTLASLSRDDELSLDIPPGSC